MTTLICDFQDIVGERINGYATLSAGEIRVGQDAPTVVLRTPSPLEQVVEGKATFENVEPGPAILQLHWNDQSVTLRFTVPNAPETITLSECIEQTLEYNPPVTSRSLDLIESARSDALQEVLHASSLVGAVLTEQGDWDSGTEYPVGSVVTHQKKRWYGQLHKETFPPRENLVTDPKMTDIHRWQKYTGVDTDTTSDHMIVTLGSDRPGRNGIIAQVPTIPATPNEQVSAGLKVTNPGSEDLSMRLTLTTDPVFDSDTNITGAYTTIPAGQTVRLTVAGTVPADKTTVKLELQAGAAGLVAGTVIHVSEAIVEKTPQVGAYFDGDSEWSSWSGTPGGSRSQMQERTVETLPTGEPGVDPTWILLSVSIEELEDVHDLIAHVEQVAEGVDDVLPAIENARSEALLEVLRASSLVGAVLTEQGDWDSAKEYPVGSVVTHQKKRWYGQMQEDIIPARTNLITDPQLAILERWARYSYVTTTSSGGHMVVTLGSTRPVKNGIISYTPNTSVTPGEQVSAGILVHNPGAADISLRLALTTETVFDDATNITGAYTTVPAGQTVRLITSGTVPAEKTYVKLELQAGIDGVIAGTIMHVSQAIIEKAPMVGPYFDGDSEWSSWTGEIDASTSVMEEHYETELPSGEPGEDPSWVLLSVSIEGLAEAQAQIAHIDQVAEDVDGIADMVQIWASQAQDTIGVVNAARDATESARASAIGAVGAVNTLHDDVVAQSAHVDDQVAAIDTAFTESVPPYLTKPTLDQTYAAASAVADIEERTAPQKMLFGLPVPQPQRAPNLAILRSMPDDDLGMNVIGTEGGVLWATGADNSLYKSDSTGKHWEHRSYHPSGIQARGGITRCADGSLLIFDASYRIRRSTDDGYTWTIAYEQRTSGLEPLTTQSIVVQPGTGHLYYGEYTNVQLPEDWPDLALIRSTDHGETWHVFHTWPRHKVAPGPLSIAHIHSVQVDPLTSDVWIMCGDGSPSTGLWKVQGETCVPMLINSMLPQPMKDAPRAIGMMFFPDYIAWGSDSTNQPHIFRMPRSAMGVDPSKLERGPRMSSTSWGTARASEDGSRWIMFSSDEAFPAHAADRMAHIYAVEDQGATVYEVGAIPSRADFGVTTLQPLAQPEEYGLDFWFNMRTGGGTWRGAWQARLGYGGQTIPWPTTSNKSFTQSQNSGVKEFEGIGSELFGVTIAPSMARTLEIWEGSAYRLSGGSAGSVRVQVMVDGEEVWRTSSASARQSSRREHGGPVARILVTAGKLVEFRIHNTYGLPTTGCASITYAWTQ